MENIEKVLGIRLGSHQLNRRHHTTTPPGYVGCELQGCSPAGYCRVQTGKTELTLEARRILGTLSIDPDLHTAFLLGGHLTLV